jgi:putative transcriptional regulator
MSPGTFIQSTSLLNDTYFENTIIYITEYNDKGAVGFIVNRLFPRKLNELTEFNHIKPFSLYEGGPVDTEHLFSIHRQPTLISGSTLVVDNVYTGGDFKQATRLINNATLTAKYIKLFIGYCGWDYQELDNEVQEGSWQVLPADNDNIDVYLF